MSATETMTTPAAETPVETKSTLPAFDYTFSSAYMMTKALYALYMPIVAAALIVTYAEKLLAALPFKVAALESLETLDAFLCSFLGKADTKVIEVKGEAVTKYETVKTDVVAKTDEFKAQVETYKGKAEDFATKKMELATAKKAEVVAKALELKETASTKVEDVKLVAAKKMEQTKVVACKVKVVAVETAVALKSEIEKDGLVVVATKAGEVAKEQVVAAYEVVKAEGVKTLVENVTTAVIEKVNEVDAAAPAPAPAPAPVPVVDAPVETTPVATVAAE